MLCRMNRIDRIFSDLRSGGRGGLMPFITAGDPDLDTTAALLPAVQRAGASIVEIGIPFSDPIADGPVIQESMTRALDRGIKVERVFEMIRGVRDQLDLGLVAMVSYSIVHRMGLEPFVERAAAAGFDGFIFPDLPLDEADAARAVVSKHGLILSMLIAPTTPTERAQQIAAASSGFVYVVSRAGITGERDDLPPELAERLKKLREATGLPIAVGFGISKAEHVRGITRDADAAIVGSAVVRRIADAREQGADAVVRAVEGFVRELAGGLSAKAAAG
jgi:tryptophan synthase alpha chain